MTDPIQVAIIGGGPAGLSAAIAAASAGVASYFYWRSRKEEPADDPQTDAPQRNPLEFPTALLFALLFVVFAALTHYVLRFYGQSGLNVLSLIVGVTDIDPFLLNLFQDKQSFAERLVVLATIQATLSNNFLKAVYGAVLGVPGMRKYLLTGFGIILGVSILILLIS